MPNDMVLAMPRDMALEKAISSAILRAKTTHLLGDVGDVLELTLDSFLTDFRNISQIDEGHAQHLMTSAMESVLYFLRTIFKG